MSDPSPGNNVQQGQPDDQRTDWQYVGAIFNLVAIIVPLLLALMPDAKALRVGAGAILIVLVVVLVLVLLRGTDKIRPKPENKDWWLRSLGVSAVFLGSLVPPLIAQAFPDLWWSELGLFPGFAFWILVALLLFLGLSLLGFFVHGLLPILRGRNRNDKWLDRLGMGSILVAAWVPCIIFLSAEQLLIDWKRLHRVDTIALIGDGGDQALSSSLHQLCSSQNLTLQLGLRFICPPPPNSQGERVPSLEDYQRNRHLKGALWFRVVSEQDGRVKAVKVERAPSVPLLPAAEIPLSVTRTTQLWPIAPVSELLCETGDYQRVLLLADYWESQSASSQWPLSGFVPYLACYVEAAFDSREVLRLDRNADKLAPILENGWTKGEAPQWQKPLLGLAYARLMLNSGRFQDADEVLQKALDDSRSSALEAQRERLQAVVERLQLETRLAKSLYGASGAAGPDDLRKEVSKFQRGKRNSPYDQFVLGRAAFSLALDKQPGDVVSEWITATRSLRSAAEDKSAPLCLRQNARQWWGAACVLSGRREETDCRGAFAAEKEPPRAACTYGVNIGTQALIHKEEVLIQVVVPNPGHSTGSYRVVARDYGAEVSEVDLQGTGGVFTATLALLGPPDPWPEFRYYSGAKVPQLVFEKVFHLAILPEAGQYGPEAFPVVLSLPVHLAVDYAPREPANPAAGQVITITARITATVPSFGGYDVRLVDSNVLKELQFCLFPPEDEGRSRDPCPIEMAGPEQDGRYHASYQIRTPGSQSFRVAVLARQPSNSKSLPRQVTTRRDGTVDYSKLEQVLQLWAKEPPHKLSVGVLTTQRDPHPIHDKPNKTSEGREISEECSLVIVDRNRCETDPEGGRWYWVTYYVGQSSESGWAREGETLLLIRDFDNSELPDLALAWPEAALLDSSDTASGGSYPVKRCTLIKIDRDNPGSEVRRSVHVYKDGTAEPDRKFIRSSEIPEKIRQVPLPTMTPKPR